MFALLTPPFMVPDEQTHLFRAYQIAEGDLIADNNNGRAGGVLPRSIGSADSAFWQLRFDSDRKLDPKTILDALHEPLESGDRKFIDFNNTAVFSPLLYLPQALAIAVAIPLELSPIGMMYLGRLANLLFVVVLIFLAIRVAPVFKRVILLIALMPMSIFLMASLSADGMTIAISLLFTALVLRSTITVDGVDQWLLLCAAAMGLCKPTYMVITILAFIIPPAKTGMSPRKWLQAALIPATSLAAAGGWAILIRDVYAPIHWVDNVNPAAQAAYIMDIPLRYITDVFLYYSASWYGGVETMIGRLGWLDTYLPGWFWTTYAVLLVLFALSDGDSNFRLSVWQRVISLGTVIVGIVSVTTAVYICCNPLRGDVVQGIQGRYFIPFLLPALLVAYNRKLTRTLQSDSIKPIEIRCYAGIVLTMWLIFSIGFSLAISLQRYYG